MIRRATSFGNVAAHALGFRFAGSTREDIGTALIHLATLALIAGAAGGLVAQAPVLVWLGASALLATMLPLAGWSARRAPATATPAPRGATDIVFVSLGASWAIGLPLASALVPGQETLASILMAGAVVGLCALRKGHSPLAAIACIALVSVGLGFTLWNAMGASAAGALGLGGLFAVALIGAVLSSSALHRQADAERRRSRELQESLEQIVSEQEANAADHAHPSPDQGASCDGIDERIRALVSSDPLTGLLNRPSFTQRMREHLAARSGEAQSAALLYIDLNGFKAINDLNGPTVGDKLLRVAGARIDECSRADELVARLDGDGFAVLANAPAGDGMLIDRAHRYLAALRAPFEIDGRVAQVTCSVGVARAPGNGDSAELLRRADLALHAAKAKGRDQMAFFDEAVDRRARERGTLESELRDALARDELVLHYQPIIALAGGETVGYEALVRWRHPTRGLLSPDMFLPLAEQAGLIVELGDWVIRRALAEVAYWGDGFRLSINLSPTQTRNPLLLGTVDSALAATGFDAKRLEFEITEHVLLQDAAAGMAMLERLRAQGVQIALDDFGTGYSSLSYLRRFRFDRIKIDRSFVHDIETCDEAQAIVSAITRMAEALGMKTTAEGVENERQLAMLRRLGCDEVQGFLILHPAEAQSIEAARGGKEAKPRSARDTQTDHDEPRQAKSRKGRRH